HRQLTSVLLPEPFGPISPTRSPVAIVRSMLSSATNPPKRLPSALTASSGSLPVFAALMPPPSARRAPRPRRRGGGAGPAPARLGGQLVVADRGEAEPEARALDPAGDADRDHAEDHHQGVEILDIAAADRRLWRADHVDAARAADKIPVNDQRLHDDRQRQG